MNQNTTPQVPGVMLYRHFYEALSSLEHETVGHLTIALMEYAFFDVEPKLPPEQEVAWAFMKNYVDRDAARYALKVAHRRAAAEKRWEKETGKANASKAPLSKGKTLPGGERCHTECDREGGGAGSPQASLGDSRKKNPSTADAVPLPFTREALEALPQEKKKEEKTFGNIEWMEQHVYRDEKGVIRYR